MKRITAIILALVMLVCLTACGSDTGKVRPEEKHEQTTGTGGSNDGKEVTGSGGAVDGVMLTEIIVYDSSGNDIGSYRFSYDKAGRLVGVVHGEDDYADQKFTVAYNEDGQITSAIYGEPAYECAMGYNSGALYEYNDKGQLEKKHEWEGGSGDIYYEYDSDGKCVKARYDGDFPSVTEYSYDASGRLIRAVETRDLDSGQMIITTTYEYDSKGRCIKEICDGYGEEYVTSYDYGCKPFALINGPYNSSSIAVMYNGEALYSIHLGDTVDYKLNDAGYIVSAECSDIFGTAKTYEFRYNG